MSSATKVSNILLRSQHAYSHHSHKPYNIIMAFKNRMIESMVKIMIYHDFFLISSDLILSENPSILDLCKSNINKY